MSLLLVRLWSFFTIQLADHSCAVLIVSYERLRMLNKELGQTEIGLLLADEGHRLKNSGESFTLSEDDS